MPLGNAVDISFNTEADSIFRFLYVNPIAEGDSALTFDRHQEMVVNHTKEYVDDTLVWCSSWEFIDLAKEQNAFAINSALVYL